MTDENSESMKTLTRHASTRCQQRGIPPLIVKWLLEYGTRSKGHHGTETCYFDKRARKRIEKACGRQIVRRLDDLLDAYLVVAEDEIVTVGHRDRRIWRH